MAQSNIVIADAPLVGRKSRSPQHSFQVEAKPFVLQPFLLAPVLPGDTLTNLLLQVRAVSDPIKNPLIGWWLEHYVFYVPHRALAGSTDFQAMMLDPAYVLPAAQLSPSAYAPYYRYPGGVDWVGQLLSAVTSEFFRDQEEPVGGAPRQWGSYLIAQVNRESWLNSILNAADFDAAQAPDVNVEGPDANTTVQASEIDIAMRQWRMLRDMRLTDATYEDFLRTYGVKVPDRETVVLPELIRYSREWTYPTNHVDPATGTPTSAVSWSVAERADKKRFFREPGFIFGVTCSRPKVYLAAQAGAAAQMLDNVFGWLPALLGDDPYASLKRMVAGTGPLSGNTDGYIVDLKDLYLYGDQFLSIPRTEQDNNLVAVPTSTLVKKYVSEADVDALFTGVAKNIRQDGVCSLTILSRVVDSTSKT